MSKRSRRLSYLAKEIESMNYKSDIWLKTQMKDICDEHDDFNSPEGKYIPDLINRKFKYVVECDGSIHDLDEIKSKDLKKDTYFILRGFKVFRIRYPNYSQLKSVKTEILKIKKPRVIIRRRASNEVK